MGNLNSGILGRFFFYFQYGFSYFVDKICNSGIIKLVWFERNQAKELR
ncbi:MAG: hypothetical protein ACLSS1_05010 [Eubacterium sp.]